MASLAAVLALCSCTALGPLDVVGRRSVEAFGAVLDAIPECIEADASGCWSLTAPDGSARFAWPGDKGGPRLYDVYLEVDAQPFLAAGLDPGRLPGSYSYQAAGAADAAATLAVGVHLQAARSSQAGHSTAQAAYGLLAMNHRDMVSYHAELDHFGVTVGDGNMIEWAHDLHANTTTGEPQALDLVFVLNPDPLVAAGLDPTTVEGWAYAPVLAMGGGRPVEVMRLLRPYDIL
jgi:hypothetical protein